MKHAASKLEAWLADYQRECVLGRGIERRLSIVWGVDIIEVRRRIATLTSRGYLKRRTLADYHTGADPDRPALPRKSECRYGHAMTKGRCPTCRRPVQKRLYEQAMIGAAPGAAKLAEEHGPELRAAYESGASVRSLARSFDVAYTTARGALRVLGVDVRDRVTAVRTSVRTGQPRKPRGAAPSGPRMSVERDPHSLGLVLTVARLGAGLTVNAAAAALGVCCATISRWERNQTVPVWAIPLLSDFYDLAWADLAGFFVPDDTSPSASYLIGQRCRQGMTARALSWRVGVTRGQVSRWEQGFPIPPQQMEKVIDALGLDPVEAMGYAGVRKQPQRQREYTHPAQRRRRR